MSVIGKMQRQYAVYWPLVAFDNYGQPVNEDPVEIKCRWDDCQGQYVTKEGRMEYSKAVIYTGDRTLALVGLTTLALGGILWRGRLANINPSGNPFGNAGAYEIKKVDLTPNFRATETLVTVHLGDKS